MLCVPRECDGVEDILDQIDLTDFYAFTYTWDKSYDFFSEFGDIAVRSGFGGIKSL
jgi:hypothetical protein